MSSIQNSLGLLSPLSFALFSPMGLPPRLFTDFAESRLEYEGPEIISPDYQPQSKFYSPSLAAEVMRPIGDFLKNLTIVKTLPIGPSIGGVPVMFFSGYSGNDHGTPSEADLLMMKGFRLKDLKENAEAIKAFSWAAKIYARERCHLKAAEAFYHLGETQFAFSAYSDADESFAQALKHGRDYNSEVVDLDDIAGHKVMASALKMRAQNSLYYKAVPSSDARDRISTAADHYLSAAAHYYQIANHDEFRGCLIGTAEARHALGNHNGAGDVSFERAYSSFVHGCKPAEAAYVRLRMAQHALARGDFPASANHAEKAHALLKKSASQILAASAEVKKSLANLAGQMEWHARMFGAYQPDYLGGEDTRLDVMVKTEEGAIASFSFIDRNTIYEKAARDAEARAQFAEAFTYRLRATAILLLDGDAQRSSEKLALALRLGGTPQVRASTKNIKYVQRQFVVAAKRISEQSIFAGGDPLDFGLVSLSGVEFQPDGEGLSFTHLSVRGVRFVLRRDVLDFVKLNQLEQTVILKTVLRTLQEKRLGKENEFRLSAKLIRDTYAEMFAI